ncbi:MAG: IS1634 family transposase [Elusimicrobia bacterium]|nr:IS1634 family transposase [Elusimicrobiota bacterium]
MHIVVNKSAPKGAKKIYSSVLLRQSYRENGKVKKRTIANLSSCAPGEIKALRLALKYKDDLSVLGSLKETISLQENLSVGAVWTVYQEAKRLGIESALGTSFAGKLALWQVISRVINQGSRLSAVRMAQMHAACDIVDIRRGFDENDMYAEQKWLSDNQEAIEKKLLTIRKGDKKPELFLYDVTSSYLEGDKNYFGKYGYNRDKKKGKKQIVIGLLCDETGEPVSTQVFSGNTQDTATFNSQVRKASESFGCERVTFVGDRGMIKNVHIKKFPKNFHYITAITKSQIKTLIKRDIIQMELFDNEICEVEDNGERYIFRRNPIRADEIHRMRLSKRASIEKLLKKKNVYLHEHPKAKKLIAKKEVEKKIEQLKVGKWLKVNARERILSLEIMEASLKEEELLDGCYVIKTDLSKKEIDAQSAHDRYKDLTLVEKAFRDCKTVSLEVKHIFVRTEKSTRAHVFIVMLAYMIERRLRTAWAKLNLTVEEGIKQLSTLCAIEVKIKGQGSCLKIPIPRKNSQELLNALNITLPTVLPHRNVRVVTRKKLMKQRKML